MRSPCRGIPIFRRRTARRPDEVGDEDRRDGEATISKSTAAGGDRAVSIISTTLTKSPGRNVWAIARKPPPHSTRRRCRPTAGGQPRNAHSGGSPDPHVATIAKMNAAASQAARRRGSDDTADSWVLRARARCHSYTMVRDVSLSKM